MHGDFDRKSSHRFYSDTKEFLYILDKVIDSESINPEFSMMIRELIDRLEHLNHRIRRYT